MTVLMCGNVDFKSCLLLWLNSCYAWWRSLSSDLCPELWRVGSAMSCRRILIIENEKGCGSHIGLAWYELFMTGFHVDIDVHRDWESDVLSRSSSGWRFCCWCGDIRVCRHRGLIPQPWFEEWMSERWNLRGTGICPSMNVYVDGPWRVTAVSKVEGSDVDTSLVVIDCCVCNRWTDFVTSESLASVLLTDDVCVFVTYVFCHEELVDKHTHWRKTDEA